MPDLVPVEETIALEIVDRLYNITTANGFPFTADVVRPNRLGSDWTPAPNTIVVVAGDVERDEEHDCPGNPPALSYAVTFIIQGFVRQSDREEASDQAKVWAMVASIKKAIGQVSEWHIFNAQNWDARWGATTQFDPSQGAHSGASVELVIYYRVSENDPYTVRA